MLDESDGLIIKQFRDRITDLKEKPWVVVTGRFDAGKSHLCNFYLQNSRLPTGYQPVTKYPTFIRHISDRPSWFKEDLWLMGPGFTEHEKWAVEDYCTDNRILAGSWDTLEQYATLKNKNNNSEGGAVLAFVDAPLLHSCVLVDLPGYGDRITDKSLIGQLSSRGAILLYLCPVQGFLGGGDLTHLADLLRGLPRYEENYDDFPKLGNLFTLDLTRFGGYLISNQKGAPLCHQHVPLIQPS